MGRFRLDGKVRILLRSHGNYITDMAVDAAATLQVQMRSFTQRMRSVFWGSWKVTFLVDFVAWGYHSLSLSPLSFKKQKGKHRHK